MLLALLLAAGFLPVTRARAEAAAIQTGQTGTITSACTITLSEELSDKAYRITDGLVETYQTFEKDDAILIDLPEGGAQGVYLEWYDATENYTVTQLDAAENVLAEEAAQPFINAYYPLSEEAKSIRISFIRESFLSTLAVYGAGDLPETVQQWEATNAADLLILAATPMDALDDFFGVIATYTVNHDVPTALVVMSRDTRTAQAELLAALWRAGDGSYPIFGDFTCDNNDSYNMTRAAWGKQSTAKYLSACFEEFSPKVVVTHAEDESAPDGAAQFAGEYARSAAEKAEIQKIYLAGSGGTTLDYETPLNGCGGMTVSEAAADAYAMCPARQQFVPSLTPADSFQLVSSAVGQDAAGDDLFENIDTASLGTYVDPTPTPTATPVPTPEPTPTEALPVDDAGEEVSNEPSGEAGQSAFAALKETVSGLLNRLLLIIPAAGLVISVAVFLLHGRKQIQAGKPRGKLLFSSALPLIVCLLLTGVLFLLMKTPLAQTVSPAETPLPTAAPTVAPTPTPTEEASSAAEETAGEALPEETPASASDEFYRQDGDPAEVIVVDEENGHWEYRSDTLSILIDRYNTDYVNNGGRTYPQVYFIAHIRMRTFDSFRTVQAAENRNGAGALKPWILARRSKAVLMITGDNLLESDSQYKSILIRDGKVFLNSAKCDTLAMYPDLTMKIFSPRETNAGELLMDGVRDAFSFGPTLIRDGEFTTENVDKWPRIGNETNPRTGIGMVEAGHFVAIVADGRQKNDYSHGMRLSTFGELFVQEGCVEAYNLDGGVSACMLFMGEQLNRHGNTRVGTIEDSYQRRIPDGLIWGYSSQVPDEDDPIYNRGEG